MQLAVPEAQKQNEPDSQPTEVQGVEETAGDGIRTHDVQLGKSSEADPNPSTDNG